MEIVWREKIHQIKMIMIINETANYQQNKIKLI